MEFINLTRQEAIAITENGEVRLSIEFQQRHEIGEDKKSDGSFFYIFEYNNEFYEIFLKELDSEIDTISCTVKSKDINDIYELMHNNYQSTHNKTERPLYYEWESLIREVSTGEKKRVPIIQENDKQKTFYLSKEETAFIPSLGYYANKLIGKMTEWRSNGILDNEKECNRLTQFAQTYFNKNGFTKRFRDVNNPDDSFMEKFGIVRKY